MTILLFAVSISLLGMSAITFAAKYGHPGGVVLLWLATTIAHLGFGFYLFGFTALSLWTLIATVVIFWLAVGYYGAVTNCSVFYYEHNGKEPFAWGETGWGYAGMIGVGSVFGPTGWFFLWLGRSNWDYGWSAFKENGPIFFPSQAKRPQKA